MNASQSRCETSYMLSISLIRLINYAGKELVDFIADYLTGIRARRVWKNNYIYFNIDLLIHLKIIS